MTQNQEATNDSQRQVVEILRPTGAMSSYAEALTANKELDGEEIIDRFIGATLAVQGVANAQETFDILDKETAKPGWEKYITRTNGLRGSAIIVADDARTGQYFGHIRERVIGGENPVMTSEHQLAGFIEAFPEADAQKGQIEAAIPWRNIIAEELSAYFSDAYVAGAWNTPQNLGSEVSGVRSSQQAWYRAIEIARKNGMDVKFLTWSAEHIKQNALVAKRDMGKVSLHQAVDNYDALFN